MGDAKIADSSASTAGGNAGSAEKLERDDQTSDSHHPESLEYFKTSYRWNWLKQYHDFYERIGDESKFSPGFFIDLWALLSLEASFPMLLVLYLCVEVAIFFTFALLLHLSSGVTPNTFERCLIASVRTVTGLSEWDPEVRMLEGRTARASEATARAVLTTFHSSFLSSPSTSFPSLSPPSNSPSFPPQTLLSL